MTFNDCFKHIKELLKDEYKEVDFTEDLYVENKVADLATAICKRYNDPAPPKPKEIKQEPIRGEGWNRR